MRPLIPDRIYKRTLERVENFLSEAFSSYQFNKQTDQKDPLQSYYVAMFEKNANSDKYRIWALYYVKSALCSYMRITLVTDRLSNEYEFVRREFEIQAKTKACPIAFLNAWEEYDILRERKSSSI